MAPVAQGTGTRVVRGRGQRAGAAVAGGSRLVATYALGGLSVTAETVLWDGSDRVEFRTRVSGSIGQEHLLRVRFPAALPGGLPVYQTATAVIGRPFGAPEADVAEHWWTLDNPANHWFGIGSAARAVVAAPDGDIDVALGVAEVIAPDVVTAEFQPVVRDLMTWLARAGVTATCSRSSGTRYGSVDVDSNLPDFRVSLGGPSENAFTAEVLAACDPSVAKRLAQLVSDGGAARLWVPAGKNRAAAFAPGADLRGPRDLPVLIVATAEPGALAAAVSELERDLMFEVIPADACGSDGLPPGDAPLGDGAVALFNRGTPGCAVTPDGTLWMSLFRACSGWPSGVWIDGDRRTAPDGSSFAWQHWSHTFCYALAATSAAGGWRSAGFNAAAEEYNHDLLALVTALPAESIAGESTAGESTAGGPGGAGPAPGGLLSVTGAPNVTLSAVKPAGNPLAAGLPGAPSRTPGEVTVRLRETDGRAAVAELRLATGIEAAWVSDLLEEQYGAALPPGAGQPTGPLAMRDGAVLVPVRPFQTVTLRVRPTRADLTAARGLASGGMASPAAAVGQKKAPATAGGTSGPGPAELPEPAQPVYARYWLHGKGPAPAGNVPVAVHFSPTRVTLGGDARAASVDVGTAGGPNTAVDAGTAGDPAGVTLTVAGGPAGGRGEVELVVPAGLTAAVAGRGDDSSPGTPGANSFGPLRYALGPNEFASWDVTVSALPGAADGRYFLTARVGDDLGQMLEDTALVTIGEPGGPDPDLEPEELFTRLQSDVMALADEAKVTVLTPTMRLGPGETGELAVRVTSRLASQLRGEVQLISPVGTWQATAPWTQPVTVEPGGETALRFAVSVPATAAPGWESWLLVKLMYFGRVRYSEAIPLSVASVLSGLNGETCR